MSKTALSTALERRKNDHLDIVLSGRTNPAGQSSGFEAVRFEHVALPELDLEEIDLSTVFLGRPLKAPLLISSMTGGPARAAAINRHLAEAAEALGIAFAVGSQRAAIEAGVDVGLGRDLRRLAPSVPLLANLGAAQFVAGFGIAEASRAVDMLEADALVVHFNPLQEAVQPEGDRRWRGVLAAIEVLARTLPVPVVAKEVGSGLSGRIARRLVDAGVAAIDVAGSGGTNWAAVEAGRMADDDDRAVAAAFAGWGIPTAVALADVRRACPNVPLIASGGIRDGVDAARAIRVGADLVGQAAAALPGAIHSSEAALRHFRILIRQLAVTCFCTGSADITALRTATLLPSAP